MKGVKHARQWREEALRGELCEPSYVTILRRHPAGTGGGAGEADLVASRPDRNRGHGRHSRSLGYSPEEALGRRRIAVRQTRTDWS